MIIGNKCYSKDFPMFNRDVHTELVGCDFDFHDIQVFNFVALIINMCYSKFISLLKFS
jgi:hypothetical protein